MVESENGMYNALLALMYRRVSDSEQTPMFYMAGAVHGHMPRGAA